MYVVEGNGSTLLGRDWLCEIQLEEQSLMVNQVLQKPKGLQALLQDHADIFCDELGTMTKSMRLS